MPIALALLPQGMLGFLAMVVALIGHGRRRQRSSLYQSLAALGFAGALGASLLQLYALRRLPMAGAFVDGGGAIVVDRFGVFCAIVVGCLGLVSCLAAAPVATFFPDRVAAFYSLVIMAAAAAVMIAHTREMFALFASFAALGIAAGLLVSLAKTPTGLAIAAVRRLLATGLASALLLYGASLLYGVSGRTDFNGVPGLHPSGLAVVPVAVGVSLLLLGMSFAMGAAPWHYEAVAMAGGTPPLVPGFLLATGTVAGVAGMGRVIGALGPAVGSALTVTAIMAGVTLVVAPLLSLGERRVSRLLGLSAASQAGFLLLAATALGSTGSVRPGGGGPALLFATVTSTAAVLTGFLMISAARAHGYGDDIAALAWAFRHRDPLPMGVALALATLAGLPPSIGFVGRALILQSLVAAGFGWLGVLAVVAWMVGLLPVVGFVGQLLTEEQPAPAGVTWHPAARTPRIIAAGSLSILLGGVVFAGPLLAAANGAAASLLVR